MNGREENTTNKHIFYSNKNSKFSAFFVSFSVVVMKKKSKIYKIKWNKKIWEKSEWVYEKEGKRKEIDYGGDWNVSWICHFTHEARLTHSQPLRSQVGWY